MISKPEAVRMTFRVTEETRRRFEKVAELNYRTNSAQLEMWIDKEYEKLVGSESEETTEEE